MGEKVYKTMTNIGISSLVLGICAIVVGVGIGTAMIVSGGILLKKKSDLIF